MRPSGDDPVVELCFSSDKASNEVVALSKIFCGVTAWYVQNCLVLSFSGVIKSFTRDDWASKLNPIPVPIGAVG